MAEHADDVQPTLVLPAYVTSNMMILFSRMQLKMTRERICSVLTTLLGDMLAADFGMRLHQLVNCIHDDAVVARSLALKIPISNLDDSYLCTPRFHADLVRARTQIVLSSGQRVIHNFVISEEVQTDMRVSSWNAVVSWVPNEACGITDAFQDQLVRPLFIEHAGFADRYQASLHVMCTNKCKVHGFLLMDREDTRSAIVLQRGDQFTCFSCDGTVYL